MLNCFSHSMRHNRLKKSEIASPIACNMWDRISPKLTNAAVKGVIMTMSKPIKC